MRRTLLLLLAIGLAALAACTSVPEWGAVGLPRQSPQGWSATFATATDSAGAVYLAGNFTDTIYFGRTRLISAGMTDAFVAKWNPGTKTFEWAVRAGGDGHDVAAAVAVSRVGVLVAGDFHSFRADFGSDTLANTLTRPSDHSHWFSDLFIARLATDGPTPHFAWAQRAGGPGDETVTALALRGTELYLAGQFHSADLILGDTVLRNRRQDEHNGQEYDPLTHGFVVKMHVEEHAAQLCWARRLGGSFSGRVSALAVQDSGVFVGGEFQGPGDDLHLPPPADHMASTAYVLKLHDRGRKSVIAWARAFGGSGWDQTTALAVQGHRVYLAGTFGSPVLRLDNHVLLNADSLRLRYSPETDVRSDVFVAALDDASSAPRFVWAQSFGGQGEDQVAGLAVCGRQLYLAGMFKTPRLHLNNTVLTNFTRFADNELFLARLTDQGLRADGTWATQAGGPNSEYAFALVSHGHHLYLAGTAFDSTQLGLVRVRVPNWKQRAFVAGLEVPE